MVVQSPEDMTGSQMRTVEKLDCFRVNSLIWSPKRSKRKSVVTTPAAVQLVFTAPLDLTIGFLITEKSVGSICEAICVNRGK